MAAFAPIPPGLFLALLLGTLYGSIIHLLFGRHWLKLPLFVLAGIGSCALVWVLGLQVLPQLPAPGGLPLLEASIVAWLLLGMIAAWRQG